MQTLTPRQQTILNRVVDLYIDTAQPVGSRHIADLFHSLYRSTYSPATLRNEMGHLEETGYLTHPHTSAGRVPTDQGYRYYVSQGVRQEDVEENVFDEIIKGLRTEEPSTETIAEKAASLLASESKQISVILVPVRSERTGREQYRLVLRGSSGILNEPEFQDAKKAGALLAAIEEKIELVEWLNHRVRDDDVLISIGEENQTEAFSDCAILSSRIPMQRSRAIISLIGPRRMRYGRNLPLVRKMAHLLGQILD